MSLSFEQVSFSYDDFPALKDVSFTLERGQIVGIIGENGAGKSTLIKNIVRFLTPDYGTISFNGENISDIPLESYPISYIPDTPVFYEELSLLEHLQFTKAIFPLNSVSVEDLLNEMELGEHLDKIPSALSKGTKQKLMIAMALLREYQILIADEPFSGLDPKQIKVLKNAFLQEKSKGKLVLLSSHLLDVVENICDQYIIIKNGRIIATGTSELLKALVGLSAEDSMESVYLKLVDCHE